MSVLKLDDGTTFKPSMTDLIGEGGQGRVYKMGTRAVKVCFDPREALQSAQLSALSALGCIDGVVVPTGGVRTPAGDLVGHTMPIVDNAEPLVRFGSAGYQKTRSIGPDTVELICTRLRAMVLELHARGVIIGDLNPYNVLVDGQMRPHLIDVDNLEWPPHLTCTALMDSVADPLGGNTVSRESDWFAFAVVTFQLWTGVHPYKGKHPTVPKLERAARGVSVFDPDVSMPQSARPVEVVPGEWRLWYARVFAHQTREPAPATFRGATQQTVPRHISGHIADVCAHGPGWIAFDSGRQVILVSTGQQIPVPDARPDDRVVSVDGWCGVVGVRHGRVVVVGEPGPPMLAADFLVRAGQRLFAVQAGRQVVPVLLRRVGRRTLLVPSRGTALPTMAFVQDGGLFARTGNRWICDPLNGDPPAMMSVGRAKIGSVSMDGDYVLLSRPCGLELWTRGGIRPEHTWSASVQCDVADIGGTALVRVDDEVWEVGTHGAVVTDDVEWVGKVGLSLLCRSGDSYVLRRPHSTPSKWGGRSKVVVGSHSF